MSGGGNDDTPGTHAQPSTLDTPTRSNLDALSTSGAVVSASAPSFSHFAQDTDAPPPASVTTDPTPNDTAATPAKSSSPSTALPFTFKRRAMSFNERLPLRSPASSARTAVASAFASVSSATTGRLAKFRSLSSDNFLTKKSPSATPPPSTADAPRSAPSSAPLPLNRGAWKANMNDFARRAKEAAKRTTRYSWGADANGVRYVSGSFEYHGEDAGAVSSYFHIVADGVSAPFGRNSLAQITHEPVSSALIANELVLAVQQALRDVTNSNASAIDLKILESVVVDAITTTRIKCFPHRQSRIAATLSVSYFDRWNGKLLTFSLGDSKCVVVRNGEIVFETPAVLRDFNMPTVVNLSHPVASSDYVLQSFALQENDLCMTFSDGIGDNLYKDDVTLAVKNAALTVGGQDQPAANEKLQNLCDELVYQSQMKISVERALELIATNDLDKLHALQEHDSRSTDCENAHPNSLARLSSASRISVHSAPVRGLFPFATAAALEYRARALEECSSAPGDPLSGSTGRPGVSKSALQVDHLACSLALFEKHQHKQTLGRHELVRRASQNRKRHYSLFQLKRLAEMQTKKPDDITLFVSHFQ